MRVKIFSVLVTGFLLLLLYYPVVNYDFVTLDDSEYVINNPIISEGLTWTGLKAAFKVFPEEYWVPVLFISYMADTEIFDFTPGSFHITNLLLHMINSILLFVLLTNLCDSIPLGFLMATLWCVHPMRVETVAWITARKDLLSTFFLLLSVLAYIVHATQKEKRIILYILTFFLSLLAMASKPSAVVIPLLFLILDWYPLARFKPSFGNIGWWRENSSLFLQKIPFVIPALGIAIGTIFIQRKELFIFKGETSFLDSINRMALSPFLYLIKTLLPFNLGLHFYSADQASFIWILPLLMAHLFILTCLFRLSRNHPYILAGWLWYLISLLPTSGLLLVGRQWLSDRFTYLASIGLVIAITNASFFRLKLARNRFLLTSSLIIAAVLFALGTSHHLIYWKNGQNLLSRAVALDPGNPVPWYLLGGVHLQKGNALDARESLERAIAISPRFSEAHEGLGKALFLLGEEEAGIHHLEEAAALKPSRQPVHSHFLAEHYISKGDYDTAIELLLGQLAQPMESDAAAIIHGDMGIAMVSAGHSQEGLSHLFKAVELSPGNTEVRFNLALSLLQAGHLRESAAHFEEILNLRPNDIPAMFLLAQVLYLDGNQEEAVRRLEKVAAMSKDKAEEFLARGRIHFWQRQIKTAFDLYTKGLGAPALDTDTYDEIRKSMENLPPVTGR